MCRYIFMRKICLKRVKIIETPETLSPRYPLRRRQTTSRRYRRTLRQRHSLNVNIYHANRVEGTASPSRHHWAAPEKQTEIDAKCKKLECIAESSKNPVKSQEKPIAYRVNESTTNQRSQKYADEERIWKEQCSPIESATLKYMDHRPK